MQLVKCLKCLRTHKIVFNIIEHIRLPFMEPSTCLSVLPLSLKEGEDILDQGICYNGSKLTHFCEEAKVMVRMACAGR